MYDRRKRWGCVDGNSRAIYRIGENRGTSPIIMRTENVLESGMQSNCVQGIQGGRRISARTPKSMEQGLCSESIRIVRLFGVIVHLGETRVNASRWRVEV